MTQTPNKGNVQGRESSRGGHEVLAGGDSPEGRSLLPARDGKVVGSLAAGRPNHTLTTRRVRCALCGDESHHTTREQAIRAGWQHYEQAHTSNPAAAVQQLPGVTFHEQALLALKALARTGRDFTVGEAHPMVSTPPPNARTDWETARKDAERLGWIEWAGSYADSVVPTSKSSAVKVWRGTAAMRRGAA